jgi:hypothetical protein
MVAAENGGGMTTRRALFFAALVSLSTALAPALSEKAGALEVTYYYLPG